MATYYASPTGNDSNNGQSAGTPKTLAGAIATANSGDIVILANGKYPGTVIQNKSNITLQAATLKSSETPAGWTSPHPARGTRYVTLEGCWLRNSPNITFNDIAFVCPLWIDTTDGTWKTFSGTWMNAAAAAAGKVWGSPNPLVNGSASIVDWDGTSHNPTFNGCEAYWGYGVDQSPFDVTANYPEYQSGAFATSGHNVPGMGDPYQSWWVDDNVLTGTATPTPDRNTGVVTTPNGRAYNTLSNGPRAFTSLSETAGPAKYNGVYIHDVSSGLTAQLNSGLTIIDQCWFDRIYKDSVFTAHSQAVVATTSGLQMTRNIFERPFGMAYDSGNPHCDILQHFSGLINPTPTTPYKLRNFWLERNIYLMRPTDRAGGQYFFLQGELSKGNPQYEVNYTGCIVRDNWGFQMGSPKGVLINAAEDCYVTNNMFVTTPGSTSSAATNIELELNAVTKYGGLSLVRNNIIELYNQSQHVQSEGNIITGRSWQSSSYNTVLVGSFPPAHDTVKAWYDNSRRTTAYSNKGPRYATIEEMILNTLSTADILPFVGWSAKQNVPPLTEQISNKSLIRGPIGSTVTVSVNIGQFRVTDPNGVVVTDWTSTPTAAAIGNYLEVKHSASSTGSTTLTQNVTLTHSTLGAQTFEFKTTTLSNIQFPTVKLLNNISPNFIGPLGTSSKKLTFAIQWRPTVLATGSSAYLFGSVNAREPLRVRTNTTGALRINFYSDAGVNALSGNLDSTGGDLGTAKKRLLIVSIDTTTGGNGLSARIYDVTDWSDHRSFNSPTIVADSILDSADITGNAALRAINNGDGGPEPEIDFVYLKMGEWIDANNPETLAKFTAVNIGPNGEGVFGSLPEVFVTGVKEAWNANTGINRGTAAKFITSNGGITDVSAQNWPPILTTLADTTSSLFVRGTPIDFNISALGYNRSFSVTPNTNIKGVWSTNTAVINTGARSSVISFTPEETGNAVFTFTNNVGYITPSPISLSVDEPLPGVIAPGTTITLTKKQAMSLFTSSEQQIVSNSIPAVQLRWKRGRGNSGPTDGMNLDYDISVTPITPGNTSPGSWTTTVYTTPTGDPQDFGYSQRPIAGWTTPMFETTRGDDIYYVGLTAWKPPTPANRALGKLRGIKEVRFILNNGPVYTVTKPVKHPIYENECYICPIRASDSTLAGLAELRAIVIPDSGQPFVLQGTPNIDTPPASGDYQQVNVAPDMWSMRINLDPTGTSLPRAVVHLAASGGNDSNSGAADSPLATIEGCYARLATLLGKGGDLGGGEIALLPGTYAYLGLNPSNSATVPYRCDNEYITVRRADNTTIDDVIISGPTAKGMYAEKVAFVGLKSSCSGQGTTGVAVFKNDRTGAPNSANKTHTLFKDLIHNGGTSFDTDPAGGGSYLWDGPGFSNLGNGHNAFINCEAYQTRGTGIFAGTLVLNSNFHHLGSSSDVLNNTKVVINTRVADTMQSNNVSVHIDGLQFQHGNNVSVVRTMHIVENFECYQNTKIQCIFSDKTTPLKDIAYIRPKLDNTGVNSPTLGIGTASTNLYVLDPEVTGVFQRWESDTPSGNSVDDGPEVLTYDSLVIADRSKFPFFDVKYGMPILFEDIIYDYSDFTPKLSDIQDIIPSSEIYGLFDPDIRQRLELRPNANGTYGAVGLLTNVDYGTDWVPNPNTAGYYTTTFCYRQDTNTNRSEAPVYQINTLNGHAALIFNGVQSISGNTKGSALTTSNAGFPNALKVSGGYVGELWFAFSQDDLATDTATRVIWAGGGTSATNSMNLKRTVTSGKNKLLFQYAVTNGTATQRNATANDAVAGSDISGPCVVRCQVLTDRIRITVWTSQYPNGELTSETLFGSGYTSAINGTRVNLGGDTTYAVGAVGQFPKMKMGLHFICAPLSSEVATEVIEYMKNYIGLATINTTTLTIGQSTDKYLNLGSITAVSNIPTNNDVEIRVPEGYPITLKI